MKPHLALSLVLALLATSLLPSCSGGGGANVNANVGGIANVHASGSGHARRR